MSRFANMDGRLKRPSAADCDPSKGTPPKSVPDDGEDNDEETEAGDGRKDKEKPMTEAELNQAKADARAEGVKAERDRFTAVLAHENYQGREAVAHKLLGKDMSAEDIIDVLATAPAAAAEAPAAETGTPDPDEAAREEMKAVLAKSKNSNIAADDGVSKPKDADLMIGAVAKLNAQLAPAA